MAALTEDSPFDIHVVGDKTKETYKGSFRAVRFLSHRQMLARDRWKREYLGPNAETSEEKSRATALADCHVSITKAPSWWSEYGNGLDLVDENLLVEVWKGIQKVQNDAVSEKELTPEQKEALKAETTKEVV